MKATKSGNRRRQETLHWLRAMLVAKFPEAHRHYADRLRRETIRRMRAELVERFPNAHRHYLHGDDDRRQQSATGLRAELSRRFPAAGPSCRIREWAASANRTETP